VCTEVFDRRGECAQDAEDELHMDGLLHVTAVDQVRDVVQHAGIVDLGLGLCPVFREHLKQFFQTPGVLPSRRDAVTSP